MEQVYPESEAPAAQVSTAPVQYYPTYKESWAALGWYLLLTLAVVVPVVILTAHLADAYKNGVVIVAAQLAQVGLILFLIRKTGRVRLVPTSWRGPFEGPALYTAVVLATVALLPARIPIDWLGLPAWTLEEHMMKLAKQPALAFMALCVLAPVLEEWLFRGLLLPGLIRNYGSTKAILQTSLLFGIIHFNPAQSVTAALLGIFLGWLYHRTQSLRVCIVVHAANNFMVWLALLAVRNEPAVLRQLEATEKPSWPLAAAALLAAVVAGMLIWYLQRLTQPGSTTAPLVDAEPELANASA